jgi:hypothetical protein
MYRDRTVVEDMTTHVTAAIETDGRQGDMAYRATMGRRVRFKATGERGERKIDTYVSHDGGWWKLISTWYVTITD